MPKTHSHPTQYYPLCPHTPPHRPLAIGKQTPHQLLPSANSKIDQPPKKGIWRMLKSHYPFCTRPTTTRWWHRWLHRWSSPLVLPLGRQLRLVSPTLPSWQEFYTCGGSRNPRDERLIFGSRGFIFGSELFFFESVGSDLHCSTKKMVDSIYD
jgi:hypothetical protein